MSDMMGAVTISMKGRIDSNNASKIEAEVMGQLEGKGPVPVKIDAQDLEYISSAGLRVLLGATQAMEDKGEMVVRNVTEAVKEVFDLTGFNNVFTIE